MNEQRNRQVIALAVLVSLVWLGCFSSACWAKTGTITRAFPVVVPYFEAPRKAVLCGEPAPLHIPDVWERFDREFTIVVYSHAQVYLWLKRMERYFPWIERELARQNLPDDLKWVAVAESDLLYTSCSPAGATGPWQFISSTGRRYGLDQTDHIDERHDFELATQSAFRYLRDLHGMFQNWTLAIAGYNCGEGRIKQSIQNQNVRDYYSLKLPLETERYVLRILAIKEVLSHPQRYGYQFPNGAGYPAIPVDRVTVSLSYALPIQSVAAAADMMYREFMVLNPAFKTDTIPPGSHVLKVHQGKGGILESRLASLKPKDEPPKQSKQTKQKPVYHKVKKGETLSGIAKRYGVSMSDLRARNKMKKDAVLIGQTLKITK